jgi:hypothetical protein
MARSRCRVGWWEFSARLFRYFDRRCSTLRISRRWATLVAVGTALAGGPRTDPSVRDYRTGLLPQVLAAKRTSGKGCITRAGGSHRFVRRFIRSS